MEKTDCIVLEGNLKGMSEKIDIIIPWVNGNDPAWLNERAESVKKYKPDKESFSEIRFQSWDNLKYWFRAVEKFFPWINQIFFVTWGHVPSWLNVENSRLKVIKHNEYIPVEYLPTYNSNVIEMNYFRIKELSENFIIFNDDMIPLQPISSDYYFKDNKVCDEAVENIIVTAGFGAVANMARYTQINNMMIINKYFKKREVQAKHPDIWFETDYGDRNERTESLRYWNDFPGFYDPHVPSAMKKSVLERLWRLEPEILDKSSRNHFRAYNDVTQYLIRYWQICEGDIYPRKTEGKVFFVDMNNYKDIAESIRLQQYPMVCINENCTDMEFEIIKKEFNDVLKEIFPNKSSFEKW